MLTTILILPGTALVFVPGVILWLTTDPETGLTIASRGDVDYWVGLVAAVSGLVLAVWTGRLFMILGQGTPAPWDPPQKLVVAGPYRHVRNPMITSVLLILVGESLFFQSSEIGMWMIIFFIVNGIYFPLSEEKGLEQRFGEDYRRYKQNVPRWLPRMTPWEPEASPGDEP
ncbi:MAG: isoprenylcysteine carboxylmethyltransferase family protein [Alphaproteobacteria bacterium]|nr:isoprenylcysteine carboxylmethyltransferase family protein [Alphaproteobacteria bacterium]